MIRSWFETFVQQCEKGKGGDAAPKFVAAVTDFLLKCKTIQDKEGLKRMLKELFDALAALGGIIPQQ